MKTKYNIGDIVRGHDGYQLYHFFITDIYYDRNTPCYSTLELISGQTYSMTHQYLDDSPNAWLAA